jgi:hypothetical protein
MALNDARFDETYKYIIYEDNGPWSVRFTSWFVPGLLYRNEGDDLDNAKEAIVNILANQLTDNFTAPWYGTWKLSPDGEYMASYVVVIGVCDLTLTRSQSQIPLSIHRSIRQKST